MRQRRGRSSDSNIFELNRICFEDIQAWLMMASLNLNENPFENHYIFFFKCSPSNPS